MRRQRSDRFMATFRCWNSYPNQEDTATLRSLRRKTNSGFNRHVRRSRPHRVSNRDEQARSLNIQRNPRSVHICRRPAATDRCKTLTITLLDEAKTSAVAAVLLRLLQINRNVVQVVLRVLQD